MLNNDPFSIDYADQLAKHILVINRRYHEQLDRQAIAEKVERGYESIRMHEMKTEWSAEIFVTCQCMLRAMNDQVNYYARRLAEDALNRSPELPRVEGM